MGHLHGGCTHPECPSTGVRCLFSIRVRLCRLKDTTHAIHPSFLPSLLPPFRPSSLPSLSPRPQPSPTWAFPALSSYLAQAKPALLRGGGWRPQPGQPTCAPVMCNNKPQLADVRTTVDVESNLRVSLHLPLNVAVYFLHVSFVGRFSQCTSFTLRSPERAGWHLPHPLQFSLSVIGGLLGFGH